MYEDDLDTDSDGSSVPFRRSYSNLISHVDGEMGSSWTTSVQPRILRLADGSHIVRHAADRQVGFFKDSNNVFQVVRSGRETLTQTAGGDLVYADPQGGMLVFHGFGNGLPVRQQGRLKRAYSAAGLPTSSTYDAAGFAQTLRRNTSSSAVEERLSFTYDGTGLLTGAQRQRVVNGGTPDVVRQVTYGYDAVLGQLRSAEVKDGAGVTLRRFHYRYYTTTEPGSYLGMLKLAIGPRNYARAVQAGLDPESTSTTDAQLLPFADKVFQYDNQRRVTQQVLRTPDVDGSGTYTYAYTARSSPPGTPGPNDWLMQFVETQPDGSVNTVFTNQAGDVLFKQTQASSGGAVVAVDAYSYTSQWRLAWHITGAALQPVSGAYYSTSYTDLIGLVDAGGGWLNGSPYVRDTVGLIERWTYYTTTGSGAADGYIDQALVQQGELGTPTLVKRYTYTSHTKP